MRIDEICDVGDGNETADAGNVVHGADSGIGGGMEHFRALYAQNNSLRREVQEIRANMELNNATLNQYLDRLNCNIQCVAIQPG